MPSPYDDLPKNQANYAPLTPLTFIERAAYVYPTGWPSCMARSAIPGSRPTLAAGVWPRRWRGAGSARTTRSR